MNEIPGVEEWLWGRLAAGAVIAAAGTPVYADLAPQGTATPYVRFGMVSAVDLNGLGAYRHAVEALYQVEAIGRASDYATLRSWAGEIDAQLHGVQGTAPTLGVVCKCTRDEVIRLTEVVEGVRWLRLGAVYRLFAAGTA